MAQLPPDGDYVIQDNGGTVNLSHRHGETPLVSFDPADPDQCATAQGRIAALSELSGEQKTFAHFWSGYFYAHATR